MILRFEYSIDAHAIDIIKKDFAEYKEKHSKILEDNSFIKFMQQKPDITLKEIVNTLELKICIETVRKALVKMGYSYKKKSLHAAEQKRSRCAGRTQKIEREYVWIKG